MKLILSRFFKRSLPGLFIAFIYSCNDSGNTTTSATTNNTIIQGDTSENKKSDAEIYAGIGKEAIQITENIINQKRKRDSIRQADKTHMWVYKIGTAFEKEKFTAEAYDRLKSIQNLFVFKKARQEYYLIKDDGFDRGQLTDSLGSFKKQLAALGNNTYRVEIIDLSAECSAKKYPVNSDPISYRSAEGKGKVECKVCD